jgi:hypothetical protein
MSKLSTQIENGSQNVDDSTVKLISSADETTEITPGQLIDEYEIAPESGATELNLAVLPNVRVYKDVVVEQNRALLRQSLVARPRRHVTCIDVPSNIH